MGARTVAENLAGTPSVACRDCRGTVYYQCLLDGLQPAEISQGGSAGTSRCLVSGVKAISTELS